MDVIFLSPGYPPEMAHYTRGLGEVGARVLGVGDSHPGSLPQPAKAALHDYLHVPRIMDEADVEERLLRHLRGRVPDRIEALWEPLVLLAARLRERLGVPGMSYDTVLGFRDKQLMKERIAAAGLRVPHAARVATGSQARATAERIGFPLIVKPIAGAGSADTYRVDDTAELERVLALTRHVPEVSVEEFVEGEEFTYDTISIHGRPAFENVAQYLPRPLEARSVESVSPVVVTIRDLQQSKLRKGIALGRAVLKALGMGTGFTHMEWYLKDDGDVVFGEIGCRPAGAHLVDQMNFTCDTDLFREWARAVCWESFEGATARHYNCAVVFKRAKGNGTIREIRGLGSYMERYGRHVVSETLLRPGTSRRDWKKTLVSDGFVMLRHPGWDETIAMARAAANDIEMTAAP